MIFNLLGGTHYRPSNKNYHDDKAPQEFSMGPPFHVFSTTWTN